jgi:hypothetical protein
MMVEKAAVGRGRRREKEGDGRRKREKEGERGRRREKEGEEAGKHALLIKLQA